MKKHIPTIREVAQACGVGPMTVSRVLNNTPGKVSFETRERVLKVVREMGYRLGATGNLMENRDTRVLGMFNYSEFRVPGYFQELLIAILKRTSSSDQGLLIFGDGSWHNDPHRSIRKHYDGSCDGVLYPTLAFPDPFLVAMRERGLPFILIGTQGEAEDTSVDVDNFLGARTLTEHLIECGHQRIAFLGVNSLVKATQEREQGYCAALQQAKLPIFSEFVDFSKSNKDYSYQWVINWLQQPVGERPTAVVCWNDELAIVLHNTLQDAGLQVPKDISLVGFDDAPEATKSRITTYRQPYDELGSWSVDLLLGRILGNLPQHISLPGNLIVRQSSDFSRL